MSDLSSRLRDYANNRGHMAMRGAAANEIDRLTAELNAEQDAGINIRASLTRTIERGTAEVRDANHEKHMAIVKKLSEISLLKGGWLDAIKAIDWFEEQTAEPCEPYPQKERDEDRKWLEDSSASGSPTPDNPLMDVILEDLAENDVDPAEMFPDKQELT